MAISLRVGELITPRYSRQAYVERLIATGRVVLAVFSLLAIWLDPFTPAKYVEITYALLIGYVGYALLMALLVWRSFGALIRLRLLTHVFDLAIFSLFLYFTEGSASPFFVYFVFSIFCAALRWQLQGTLWTMAVALVTFIGLGVSAATVLHDPDFELNRFIIRCVYLAVVAMLLGYSATYEQKLRGDLSQLAAWPSSVPLDICALVQGLLERAANILEAPRLLMAWDDPEEPWLYLASWSHGKLHLTQEPPTTYQPLVAERLAGKSFFCQDARAPLPMVLYPSTAGLQRWDGPPLHADLPTQFAMGPLLAMYLHGESLEGYLFALDKEGVISDDLILGSIVAREVASHMEQYYLLQRLQQTAAIEERIRLTRDLHDGLLQSMTGAGLQLETVCRLIVEDPQAARGREVEIQRLLAAEQRDLRSFIRELLPTPAHLSEAEIPLPSRLEQLSARIERHWGLRVELRLEPPTGQIRRGMAHEIFFIVHEALINAARHAHASTVRVELDVASEQVRISIADNGRGFSFRGHYSLDTLMEMKLGPRTLRERVASLGGSLAIDSSAAGAHLEIIVPLTRLAV
jgi:signal transduction histidine kinase